MPAAPRAPAGHRRFPLLPYFAAASLVCTLITALALGALYRRHEVDELLEQARRETAAFAQVLSYTLRGEVAALLQGGGDAAAQAVLIERVHHLVQAQGVAFGAAKVKIYTRAGLTVYSTRKADIGKPEENNAGVQGALRGQVTSSLVHRDQFNTFDHVIENRDLLQVYLPVPGSAPGEVIGVFELYSDMTGWLARIRSSGRVVMASVAGVMMVLYGLLFAIVYRADRIIKRQDGELQAQVSEIHRANRELERRVLERTDALEQANRKLQAEMAERETAERELEQARQGAWQQDKLAAIGRLAAGIVHEIGNPLAAVRGLVDEAREELAGRRPQAVERSLHMAQDYLRRMESITRDVSGFSVPPAHAPELVNLNELLTRLVNGVRYDVKLRDVQFDLQLDPGLPVISGTPDQLWLMILNLVLNAAEAIARKDGAARTITVSTVHGGTCALLTVRDQGAGMDDAELARAFEPFHTTKAPGEGMGIGLSFCYSIARRHGGEISIASQPQVGTTVRVSLPLAPALPG